MGERIAFVCDMHAGYAVGGAQRYYAELMREFARRDAVTYLTRAFWPGSATRDEEGVEVIGLTRTLDSQSGDRGMRPKLAFALGLAAHLLRHGGRYRVVHCCCFPHVALLACRIGLLPHRRTLLVADWHEVLPRATWRRRLGRTGELGWLVQRLGIGAGRAAVTFSRMHERRLRAEGRRRAVHVVPEFPTGSGVEELADGPSVRERRIVFAGRLVAEKRAHLVPAVLAHLRRADPAWRATVFGDGPERTRVEVEAARAGVTDALDLAGFASWSELSAAMSTSAVLLAPTEREGFGLIVLEAAGHGLPCVLVAAEDNAAVELVEPGRNGLVRADADPAGLAEAVRTLAADPGIHAATRGWYEARRGVYSVESCAAALREVHAEHGPR